MSAVWPARPTTYRGIPMRSRLEARAAAMLDDLGFPWTYEPRAYADQTGQYLPDFELTTSPEDPPVFLEVKPTTDAATAVMPRMEVIWSSEPDALLVVLVPGEPWYVRYPDSPWTTDDTFPVLA